MIYASNQILAANFGRRFGNIVLKIERLPPLSAVALYSLDKCISECEGIIRDESVDESVVEADT